jgi:hypothetical protein
MPHCNNCNSINFIALKARQIKTITKFFLKLKYYDYKYFLASIFNKGLHNETKIY